MSINDKIVHLKVVKAGEPEVEVHEDTVKLLRDVLRDAKKGVITEVVIVAKGPDNWQPMCSATCDFLEWIGRLRVLETDWINRYNARTPDAPEPRFDKDDE